jgi:hypothetical protein
MRAYRGGGEIEERPQYVLSMRRCFQSAAIDQANVVFVINRRNRLSRRFLGAIGRSQIGVFGQTQ